MKYNFIGRSSNLNQNQSAIPGIVDHKNISGKMKYRQSLKSIVSNPIMRLAC